MLSIQEYLEKHFFPGYKIAGVIEDSNTPHIVLEPKSSGVCQACGSSQTNIHDYYQRYILDLPILGKNVIIDVKVRRVICKCCNHKGVEFISWLAKTKYAHCTERKVKEIVKDCHKDTIKDVSIRHKVNHVAVKDIHKEYLMSTQAGRFSLGNSTILGVDEFSIAKHHTYATVVVDLQTSRVIWVGKGKTISTLNEFFHLCGKEGCKQIKAVAMDQNASFETSVKNKCPNAVVVYDLFHMISKYGLTVLSHMRTKLAEQYKESGNRSGYYDMKGARWILLGNNCNLKTDARERLNTILSWNKPLEIAYMLKEQIRDLYFCASIEEATNKWNQWKELALASGVEEVIKFAKIQDRKYKDGIINSALFKIGTSIVEGINNKIKVLKRKAYGLRDFDYFALLIKAAFPGKVALPRNF